MIFKSELLIGAIEVCSLLCVNDEEKSGVVLGYFLCISQLYVMYDTINPILCQSAKPLTLQLCIGQYRQH